jgi:hypothetical protein
MIVHLQSPFALIVGGVPHSYLGIADDDGMHHYRFYLSPKDMGMFLASLQHAYGQYADMRMEMSEIPLSVFWWFRYYGRRHFETARLGGRTMTRSLDVPGQVGLRAERMGSRYVFDLYAQSVDHWVRHKRYDKWQDALRASAILVSHDERGEA